MSDAESRTGPDARLRELGIELPAAPPALAHYALATRSGKLLFLAGQAPLRDGAHAYVGKVGREFTLEQGYDAARLTALNMLATLRRELGDLARVRQVLRLFGMVNCTEDFVQTPDVIDGASDLFVDLWGDTGLAARSAVGMQQLHYGMAIEIEGTFAVT